MAGKGQLVSLTGTKKLSEQLHALSKKVEPQIILSEVLIPPARVLRDAIRAVAPRGKTGALHRAIQYETGFRRGTKTPFVIVKVDAPTFEKVHKVHPNVVEFGTGPRVFKKPMKVSIGGNVVTITHTGSMPAQPFFRPAVDASKTRIRREIRNGIKRLINQVSK